MPYETLALAVAWLQVEMALQVSSSRCREAKDAQGMHLACPLLGSGSCSTRGIECFQWMNHPGDDCRDGRHRFQEYLGDKTSGCAYPGRTSPRQLCWLGLGGCVQLPGHWVTRAYRLCPWFLTLELGSFCVITEGHEGAHPATQAHFKPLLPSHCSYPASQAGSKVRLGGHCSHRNLQEERWRMGVTVETIKLQANWFFLLLISKKQQLKSLVFSPISLMVFRFWTCQFSWRVAQTT